MADWSRVQVAEVGWARRIALARTSTRRLSVGLPWLRCGYPAPQHHAAPKDSAGPAGTVSPAESRCRTPALTHASQCSSAMCFRRCTCIDTLCPLFLVDACPAQLSRPKSRRVSQVSQRPLSCANRRQHARHHGRVGGLWHPHARP